MSENILSPVPPSPAPEPAPTVVPIVTAVPKKSPVFLFIALVSLSLVSVLATYLFLQVRTMTLENIGPSPSPTAPAVVLASAGPSDSWKIYTNRDQNYSFNFPITSSLKIKECSQKRTVLYDPSNTDENYACHSEWYNPITITVSAGNSANRDSYYSEEFTQSLGQADIDWKITFSNLESNAPPGTLLVHLEDINTKNNDTTGCCSNFNEAKFFHNGNTFVVTQGIDLEFKNEFNQILSSFKFTSCQPRPNCNADNTYCDPNIMIKLDGNINWCPLPSSQAADLPN